MSLLEERETSRTVATAQIHINASNVVAMKSTSHHLQSHQNEPQKSFRPIHIFEVILVMPSYVVVGASRGLGYTFLQHLARDPQNVIFGTARSVEAVVDKVDKDGLKNVSIVQADLLDRSSIQKAASQISKQLGGKLDYLILNAAYASTQDAERFLDEYNSDPENLERELEMTWKTNVVGVIDSINAFLPLIKRGSAKKVLTLSTGMADIELIREYDIWEGAAYSISKAGLNAVVAKYAARYGTESILLFSISPGFVNTGNPRKLDSKLALYRC